MNKLCFSAKSTHHREFDGHEDRACIAGLYSPLGIHSHHEVEVRRWQAS